ncbi:MAG: hypothetical protein LBL51_01010 [Synergistaceae bacterium]|jgi:hypothetical protein|nr:hypothetical protein [Synergistaceae bacterium]
MRKIFSLLLLLAMLSASAGEAREASEAPDGLVDVAPDILTATVILLDLKTEGNGVSFLTVKFPEGQTFTFEAAGHCRFIDDGKRDLSPADFAKRYKEKQVTIDSIEHGPNLYVVEECRSGTR